MHHHWCFWARRWPWSFSIGRMQWTQIEQVSVQKFSFNSLVIHLRPEYEKSISQIISPLNCYAILSVKIALDTAKDHSPDIYLSSHFEQISRIRIELRPMITISKQIGSHCSENRVTAPVESELFLTVKHSQLYEELTIYTRFCAR